MRSGQGGLNQVAGSGEGLEEPWEGSPGGEWLGTDGVVESLGCREGFI